MKGLILLLILFLGLPVPVESIARVPAPATMEQHGCCAMKDTDRKPSRCPECPADGQCGAGERCCCVSVAAIFLPAPVTGRVITEPLARRSSFLDSPSIGETQRDRPSLPPPKMA